MNTSDHLPIVAALSQATGKGIEDYGKRVFWEGMNENYENAFVSEVQQLLRPFLNSVYSDVKDLGSEIGKVSKGLVDCAVRTLPLVNGKKRRVWY